MPTTLTRSPLTPRPRARSAVGAAALAALVVVGFLGASRLVAGPHVVPRITIANATDDLVNVLVVDDGSSRLPLTIVEPRRTAVTHDVIDQGDTWTFVFRTSGRTLATVEMSRDDLQRAHWRVAVPNGTNTSG
jgi:hypothetical protein